MARCNYSIRYQILLSVAALVSFVSLVESEKSGHGISLSHVCVHPKSCSIVTGSPIIMLHGLTDIKETWDGIYQEISELTSRTVCIYDARNHGSSGWNTTFTVDILAEDLETFMNMMKMDRATLVGHSMGGRTVMKFALKNPGRVDGFFVEDMGLKTICDENVKTIRMRIDILFRSLLEIPDGATEAEAKEAVLDFLHKVAKEPVPPHFAKNLPLVFKDGKWQCKTNFHVIRKALDDIDVFFPEIKEGIFEGTAFFLYGTASPYKIHNQKEAILKIFPQAKFVAVTGAGHSIHSRHPEFLENLINFLG